MTSPSFMLKVDRAREHLHAFDVEASAWIEGKPYAAVDEPDPGPFLYPFPYPIPGTQARRFRVVRVDPVPDPLGPIIGDCVHNLRSSLDHLALALARSFTPAMTEGQIEGSEFPVSFTRPMTSGEENPKRSGASPRPLG